MNAKSRRPWLLTLFIVGFLGSGVATAQSTPQRMKVQGFLSDTSGAGSVPASGTFSMTFELYDASLGGSLIQSIGPSPVVVTDGLYSVNLPFVLTDFDSSERWIEITVDGETLSPRVQLVTAPFAFVADTVDGLDGSQLEESAEIMAGDANLQVQIDAINTQIAGAGNTLDEAYDENGPGAGRMIAADTGPVHIAGPDGLLVDGKVAIAQTLGVGVNTPPNASYPTMHVATWDVAYTTTTTDPGVNAQSLVSILNKATLSAGDENFLLLGFVANDDGGGNPDRRFWAKLAAVVEDPDSSSRKAGLKFMTGPDNPSDNQLVEKLRITSSGRVGIGTAAPDFPLEMASGAHVTAGGVWTDASSRERKANIRDLTTADALAALNNLRPRTFAFRADPEDQHVGFIAEEVPDLVATPNRKGLSPMDIVGVLTKVVQEQQTLVRELTAKVEILESQVATPGPPK